MAFDIPERSAILARILGDFRTEVGAEPLRRSVERALAVALMGQSRAHYGVMRYGIDQCFVDTADDQHFWRWAQIYGITQKPAVAWYGTIDFTGTNGTSIPDGTALTRADGSTYTTDGAVTISGGTATAVVFADLAGADGSCDNGTVLTLSSPIAGVDPDGAVASTATEGSDAEDKADALVRVLLRLRTPPSGGGPGDYVRWALEVPGVTRAWEFPLIDGPNTVAVAFVRDDDGTGSAILPDAGERADVLAHLQERAPITASVSVITLTALTVDVQISALTPDTAGVRTAIETSLADLFSREAEPNVELALSRIDAAISGATGEVSHVLDLPATAPSPTSAQIPILGTVTYV